MVFAMDFFFFFVYSSRKNQDLYLICNQHLYFICLAIQCLVFYMHGG